MYKKGVPIAIKQLKRLKAMRSLAPYTDPATQTVGGNYRPLQEAHNRTVLENYWHERQLELREEDEEYEEIRKRLLNIKSTD